MALPSSEYNKLVGMNVCQSALDYSDTSNSLQEKWGITDKGYWMLWYLVHNIDVIDSVEGKLLVSTLCECAQDLLAAQAPGYQTSATITEAENWANAAGLLTDLEDHVGITADKTMRFLTILHTHYINDKSLMTAARGLTWSNIIRTRYPTMPV